MLFLLQTVYCQPEEPIQLSYTPPVTTEPVSDTKEQTIGHLSWGSRWKVFGEPSNEEAS